MSLLAASEKHGLNRQTLKNKMSANHTAPYGRPTELTGNEETKLAEHIKVLGDWGFPVIAQDIRMFVKGYLDKVGVQNSR